MVEQDWQAQCLEYIGRTKTVSDALLPNASNALFATLNDDRQLSAGDALPSLFHWLHFHEVVRNDQLTADGHEKRGNFLPPVPYSHRMWAGSTVTFDQPVILGEPAEQLSTIRSIEFKNGSSGPLCFTIVEHVVLQNQQTCLTDLQTIVYRDGETKSPNQNSFEPVDISSLAEHEYVMDPVTLFRYSALTFNAHRIHYDHDYVRDIEGYPGLVVHGPLMATLLMRHAQTINNSHIPSSFTFRGLAPVFAGEKFRIENTNNGGDAIESVSLTLTKADGTKAVSASVKW